MSKTLRENPRLKRWCCHAFACACALTAGAPPAAAQAPQPQPAAPSQNGAPNRPLAPAPSYSIEGPYGPYSDLVPNSGQMSSANSPFAGLPNGQAPYAYPRYPAYAPAAPSYPVVPSYTPAYTPPPPPPPAYSQYPQPGPPPPIPHYAQPAAPPPQMRQIAAEPEDENENKSGNPAFGLITEMKAGILYHDAGVFGRNEERGADVDGEIRFLPWEFLNFMASPRPHFGFHINTAGDTSQVFTGLTWEWNFLPPFFADASFGLAVHDGAITTDALHTKELGSRVLFRESVEIGWNFYGPHNVSVLVDHVSHGTMLGPKNEGMDSLGVRYGYRF